MIAKDEESQALIEQINEKLRHLPAHRLQSVYDFVRFMVADQREDDADAEDAKSADSPTGGV